MPATTLHRSILAGELGIYLLLAYGLQRHAGWSAAETAVLVTGLALAGRAFVIAVTFAFARVYASSPPQDQRIGFGCGLFMALQEYAAFVLLFSLVLPFERLFLGEDRLAPPAVQGRLPVLLIHGYQCNRGFWVWLRQRIERAGWTVATLSLEPVFGDIDGYVDQVARRIEEICSATGAAQVILVGHSMGGLVSRAYLRRCGNARVARLVTLGTPHHGSRLAVLGLGENGRQMVPGSAWLDELAKTSPGVPTLSIFSWQDNYVMPQDSPILGAAEKNVALAGIGHLAMAISPRTAEELLKALGR
jgi:triacylglycerol lipase